jgi:hypothetical protein
LSTTLSCSLIIGRLLNRIRGDEPGCNFAVIQLPDGAHVRGRFRIAKCECVADSCSNVLTFLDGIGV